MEALQTALEEMRNQIQAQEMELFRMQEKENQMQANAQAQAQVIVQMQQHIQTIDQQDVNNILALRPDNILTQFCKLKPFNGKLELSLSSFIKSVENALLLCGNNDTLKNHGLSIVMTQRRYKEKRING